MFLQRIYTQLTDQNWAAVFVELLVVAVGIFMGLQASNWNDDRIERTLERGYLVRLHEDILASAKGIERDNEALVQQLADQATILAALDSCEVTANNKVLVQRGIASLGFINPPRLLRRTVDDLAASGRIGIIQSDTIKEELASIVAEVEWRDNVMDSVLRLVDHHRTIIDEQVRYDVSTPIEGPEWAVAVNFDIGALCSQPRNAAAISAISFSTRDRLIAFRKLAERYRAFLPLIENELQSRWGYTVVTE